MRQRAPNQWLYNVRLQSPASTARWAEFAPESVQKSPAVTAKWAVSSTDRVRNKAPVDKLSRQGSPEPMENDLLKETSVVATIFTLRKDAVAGVELHKILRISYRSLVDRDLKQVSTPDRSLIQVSMHDRSLQSIDCSVGIPIAILFSLDGSLRGHGYIEIGRHDCGVSDPIAGQPDLDVHGRQAVDTDVQVLECLDRGKQASLNTGHHTLGRTSSFHRSSVPDKRTKVTKPKEYLTSLMVDHLPLSFSGRQPEGNQCW